MSTDKEAKKEVAPKEEAKKTECAVVHCPPLKTSSSDFIGLKISKVRSVLEETLEIPPGATVSVSKDGGKHYEKVNDDYIIQNQDHVEFGRGSSRKGRKEHICKCKSMSSKLRMRITIKLS